MAFKYHTMLKDTKRRKPFIYLLHLPIEDGRSYGLCQILRNELKCFPAMLQSQGSIIIALGIFGKALGIFEGRSKGGKLEAI